MCDSRESKQKDALIVVRCQLGEEDAFTELVQCWAEPLRRHLLRITRDDQSSYDLAQEIWIKVIRGIPRLRDPMKFRAWMFGIAHHVLVDRVRELTRQPPTVDLDDHEPRDETDFEDRALTADRLERGLEKLAPAERETLTLFYLEQLPLKDIAALQGLPTGTVKSRLHRARTRLRHHLNQLENVL